MRLRNSDRVKVVDDIVTGNDGVAYNEVERSEYAGQIASSIYIRTRLRAV